jgi:uncharacterized protein (DUF427 family)
VSLTTGRGPLSAKPAGRFTPPIPDHVVYVEPFLRRVRAVHDGRTVVDTEQTVLVHRPGHPPIYAFPLDAVHGISAEAVPEAPGHVHVPWDAVDAWYEEDEQVFGHPRNPYHRIDCVRTRRRLRVEVGGVVLVDSDETVGMYETALATQLYVARDQVRTDLLVPSTTAPYCPYKGTASYWSAVVDGVLFDDVAWSYDDPLPECMPVRGLLSFDVARATVIQDVPMA